MSWTSFPSLWGKPWGLGRRAHRHYIWGKNLLGPRYKSLYRKGPKAPGNSPVPEGPKEETT